MDSALDIVSLNEMKVELGLPLTITSRDTTITGNIRAGVSSIVELTGLPLLKREDVWEARFPNDAKPLDLPYEHVTKIVSVAYWTAADSPDGVPTGSIAIADLGALRRYAINTHGGALLGAPAAGWPETHAERPFAIVTMEREADVPAALKQCAILAARDFFEGQRNRPANDAIEIVARPFVRTAHPDVLERLGRAAAGTGRPGAAVVPATGAP